MLIPPELTTLIEQLNQELTTIEREGADALGFARAFLKRLPNNFTVIQLSAFLNTAMFFAETSRRQIQALVKHLLTVDRVTNDEIQELGEDLATDLGRAIETKIRVIQVKERLENLQ